MTLVNDSDIKLERDIISAIDKGLELVDVIKGPHIL